MMEVLLLVIKLIFAVLGIILTKYLVPFVIEKVGTQKLQKAIEIVTIAVKAAEQIFKETKAGKSKKEYVKKYLALSGIKLSDTDIEVLIESAVQELSNQYITLTEGVMEGTVNPDSEEKKKE